MALPLAAPPAGPTRKRLGCMDTAPPIAAAAIRALAGGESGVAEAKPPKPGEAGSLVGLDAAAAMCMRMWLRISRELFRARRVGPAAGVALVSLGLRSSGCMLPKSCEPMTCRMRASISGDTCATADGSARRAHDVRGAAMHMVHAVCTPLCNPIPRCPRMS